MITRRKTPWGVFLLILLIAGVVSYYISGLYKIPDVSLTNLEESLLYIAKHPLENWWNEKSITCIGIGFLGWIMFVGWYMFNYRNFQYDKEQGSEDWGDAKRINKELKGNNPKNVRILSENVSVSKEEDILSNNNMIVVAASGRYKTTAMVETNLATLSASYVMLDVKGATQRKMGNYFLKHGYDVRSFNLKEPWLSDRYNPFKYLERESDLIRLITNLQAAVKKPNTMQSDPFWDDGVRLYLQAVFYAEWLEASEQNRFGNMNNILKLVNMESKKLPDGNTTELQFYMDTLAKRKGDDYPPVRDYRKLKEGATETVRSIVIMVNAMLSLCETADIKRIFSDDDINIRDIGTGVDGNPNRKVVLFLVLPDNDKSFNFIINMFYTQLFDILMRLSDDEIKAPLPVPVEVWADEFYAGPKPADPDALMGVIRSRNISLIPILQSIAQLQTLYKDNQWKIMFDNASVFAFFGAAPGAYDTHKYISDLLGEMTIDTLSDGINTGRNSSGNKNFGKKSRLLMTPGEVKRMRRKDCILFIECEAPIYDRKYLPFKTPLYKEFKQLGSYEHQVKAVYNKDTMQYRTITNNDKIQILSQDDAKFYREASKDDKRIKVYEVDEKEMLYLNWHKQPEPSEDEIANLFQKEIAKTSKDKSAMDVPYDVKLLRGDKEPAVNEMANINDKKTWNLSGSIYDCIKRYASQLTDAELNEILSGIEAGLSDKEIKSYFCLPANKMEQYRRAYAFNARTG